MSTRVRCYLVVVRLRGLNYGLDGAADVIGSAIAVGLAAVEPGDDCFEGNRRDQPRRPLSPWAGRYLLGESSISDLGRGRPDAVNHVAKLRLSRSMTEQQSEPVRIGCGCVDEQRNTVLVEVVGAHALGESSTGALEHRAVEVRLGCEVPIEDDVTDAGFCGDVVQTRGCEAPAGKRASGGVAGLVTYRGPSPA